MSKFRFFGSSRGKTGHREANNEEHRAFVPHSSPAIGWGTVGYPTPDSWKAYMDGFRGEVTAYLERTHPDIYNGCFMDRQVRRNEKLAITQARDYCVRNEKSIHNIRTYQTACLSELELTIAYMEEELKRCQEEVSKC